MLENFKETTRFDCNFSYSNTCDIYFLFSHFCTSSEHACSTN